MRRLIALAALPLLGAAAGAELKIRVTDGAGQPVWTRLEVHGPDGKMHQAAGSIVDPRQNFAAVSKYPGSFVVNGNCALDLPPGQYTVVAEHGLEYPRVERTIALAAAGASVEIALKPWICMYERGWYSGDMHVHRTPEDAPALAQAEDVNLSVVFTMWNRRNLWAGRQMPANPVQQVAPRHLLTLMNAEDERAGGAWMFHHIREPLGLEKAAPEGQPTTQVWDPPGLDFITRVRRERATGGLLPWFDAEKAIWWEVPVVMALEAPDSLGLLNNHFHQYGMMDNEAWGRARDAAKHPGATGFADYVLSLYYRYLNLGFRLPPSAGSASGVLPNPVGYNRMYAYVTGAFTVEKWYAAVREHKVFVTNGPMLFWNPRLEGNTLRVNFETMAREPIDRVEIVANGKVLRKVAPRAGARTLRSVLTLNVKGHSWVAARCYLKTKGTVRMAHTAPIYLPGEYNAADDARFFLQWIDELIAKTDAQPQREKLHAIYRRAREFYAKKAGDAPKSAAASPFRDGVALLEQGRAQDAVTALIRATVEQPGNAEAFKALGVALASMNDYALAEPAFQRACSLKPDLEDACYYHARALYLLDRYEPAIAQFRKLIADRQPARTQWALAQALEAAGKAGEAETEYLRAIASDYRPGKADGDPTLLYGVFLYRQGRIEESRGMLEKAVLTRPDSARAFAELGRVLLQTGETARAATLLKRALQLDPAGHTAKLMLEKAEARLAAQGSATSR